MAAPTNPAPGGDAGAATAQPGAANATPDASADRNNHEARIRAGGDWAVEYIKKLESRADKAERDAREAAAKTAPLSRYFEGGLTPAQLASSLGTFEKVLGDPTVGPAIKSYIATGKFEMPKASNPSDDDEYLSDEAREIRALKAEVAEIRSLARESHVGLGSQALTQNVSRVAQDLGLNGEEFERVKSRASDIMRGWQSQGEAGLNALRALQHPENGLRTTRTLVLEALGDDLESVYRRKIEKEHSTRRGMATDSPSPHRAGASRALPEFASMLEALQATEVRPEIMDENGY